jgi:ABC-2 type transport system permease protein
VNFFILFRKELIEQIKSFKLLIVGAVLLIFGLSTPLLIKFLPEILKMSGEQIPMQLPNFMAKDAIQSYIGNLSQIGLLVAVLIAMGSIAQERERRTVIMTLSKPAGFGAFVLAKLVALAVTFGVGLLLGAFGCYVYTVVLLGEFSLPDFVLINLLAGFYLLVCLAVTVMYSAIFRSQLAAAGLAFITLIGLALVSNLPIIGDYVPSSLMAQATNIAMGTDGSIGTSLIGSLIVCGAILVATMIVAWQVLRRKEL